MLGILEILKILETVEDAWELFNDIRQGNISEIGDDVRDLLGKDE